MLFRNQLVNIVQIHEEGTAMAQIRIHVLHCGKIGVAPNLPESTQRDCFWWMLGCRAP